MFRYLMENVHSIKWVGLGAQSYVVSTINGMKVGFIAVCVLHTECAQESINYPSLSPVKYNEKTFTSMVKKLHEVIFCYKIMFCKPLYNYCSEQFQIVIFDIVIVPVSKLHHYVFSVEVTIISNY